MWFVKQAPNTLDAMLADGSTVTVPAGDWLIYPAPQLVEGEMPATTVVETNENINTLYT